MEHNLSERHARELLRVHGEDQRLAVIEELSRRNFSVAQTSRYIDTLEAQSAISGPARYRRRETRLVLERVARDAALLRVEMCIRDSSSPSWSQGMRLPYTWVR